MRSELLSDGLLPMASFAPGRTVKRRLFKVLAVMIMRLNETITAPDAPSSAVPPGAASGGGRGTRWTASIRVRMLWQWPLAKQASGPIEKDDRERINCAIDEIVNNNL